MALWQSIVFVVVFSSIRLFVLSDYVEDDTGNYITETPDDENLVLDSVYDTMRNNYETKMRQNLARLNLISDIRNKRNVNEPMSMSPMSMNTVDYYKNHQYEVNRKNPVNFPLGFKSPSRLLPISSASEPHQRSDYEYEEYHKCQEKPSVQTFHIQDDSQEKNDKHPGISTVLLTGLKYLFGGFAILALPFIVLKALLFPLKVFMFFKTFALIKSFFVFSVFLRFLRLHRRLALINGGPPPPFFPFFPGKNKNKLQSIKDILNSENMDEDVSEDADYKSEDEDVMSKENVAAPMLIDSPFNTSEVSEEFVQNLVKLIKLRNKKW